MNRLYLVKIVAGGVVLRSYRYRETDKTYLVDVGRERDRRVAKREGVEYLSSCGTSGEFWATTQEGALAMARAKVFDAESRASTLATKFGDTLRQIDDKLAEVEQ
jgi:hypothetical protein